MVSPASNCLQFWKYNGIHDEPQLKLEIIYNSAKSRLSSSQNLTDYEKALISAKLAFSAKTKGYFEMAVCSTPTNHAIVAFLS